MHGVLHGIPRNIPNIISIWSACWPFQHVVNMRAISEMLFKLCHHVCQLTIRATINIMSACYLGKYIQTTFEIMIGDNMFRTCIINEECWCWRDLIWPQNIVTHVGAYTMSITFQTSIRWRTLTSFGYYVICSNVCC